MSWAEIFLIGAFLVLSVIMIAGFISVQKTADKAGRIADSALIAAEDCDEEIKKIHDALLEDAKVFVKMKDLVSFNFITDQKAADISDAIEKRLEWLEIKLQNQKQPTVPTKIVVVIKRPKPRGKPLTEEQVRSAIINKAKVKIKELS